jgi:hypothetical protein
MEGVRRGLRAAGLPRASPSARTDDADRPARRSPRLESGQAEKSGMRHEHAAAIVAEGLKRGTRRHRSVALGVPAQFELTMRQADVIGVWEKLGQAEAVEPGTLVERGCIWRPGLRFEDFAAGQLDLETLKNAGRAVFDVPSVRFRRVPAFTAGLINSKKSESDPKRPSELNKANAVLFPRPKTTMSMVHLFFSFWTNPLEARY